MKRLLRKANHVSPAMHSEVQTQIADPNGDRSKILMSKNEFLLAKRLISELPIVATNEFTYELAQSIYDGAFNDISSIEEANNNWDNWKYRTIELFRKKGVIIS